MDWILLNFIYSEKAAKLCEIFPLLLTNNTYSQKGKISQTFVAFSEYMNFTYKGYTLVWAQLWSKAAQKKNQTKQWKQNPNIFTYKIWQRTLILICRVATFSVEFLIFRWIFYVKIQFNQSASISRNCSLFN